MQLPSTRTLKHFIDANLEEAGECLTRLTEERRQYISMVEKRREELKEKEAQKGLLLNKFNFCF